MKTQIKIKPFNGRFDFFISINDRVVHCEIFKTIEEAESNAERLVELAKNLKTQAEALETKLNAMLGGGQ